MIIIENFLNEHKLNLITHTIIIISLSTYLLPFGCSVTKHK